MSSAAKRLVVVAKKDDVAIWAWTGGYVEKGQHMGKPYFERDISDGQKVFYIFYHKSWDTWFIADRMPQGTSISFSTQAKGPASSPELADWPADAVQSIAVKKSTQASWDIFKDPEFPHRTVPSINRPGNRPIQLPHGDPHWVPGRAIREEKWRLFDGIDPRDLLQGRVGDCWLLAAMATMAEFPLEVKKLFVRDGSRQGYRDGKYVIRLFDHVKDSMVDVTIDEFFPCRKMHWWHDEAEPCFAQPNGNELWCLLLEKAMAKMWGSYGDLHGGTASGAFRALTGEKEQIMWSTNDKFTWGKMTIVHGSVGKFEFPPVGQEKKNREEMFTHLWDCDQKNFLMAASIAGGNETVRPDGLVEGHAYSLLQIVRVTAKSGETLRLLELRNPWGSDKEWNGPWCDKHQTWDRYPEVRKQLRPKFGGDGVFWMDWESFARTFTGVNVCPKAMREGFWAEQHTMSTLDWKKFIFPDSKPPPPSHSHRPAKALVDGGRKLLLAALGAKDDSEQAPSQAPAAPPPPLGTVPPPPAGSRWQFELKDGTWQDYDDRAQEVMNDAATRAQAKCVIKVRHAKYEIDLQRRLQRRVQRGCVDVPSKERRVRLILGAVSQGFAEGQKVHIWSDSTKTWETDGIILQVLRYTTLIDGSALPVGTVKVQYGGGRKTKWLMPAYQNQLRHAGQHHGDRRKSEFRPLHGLRKELRRLTQPT